ncbi:hypothetical protein [Hymenobacter sp. CRA2]|uniref:hypothetical protein n=1 Tax=Hymenobacter sp. CRA2 TaxID=1955620 RepID=UPI00098EC261|nr:hypothetical protein [Hymenobacter sp. CRA2]OON67284.1 hypothetical protein B0919_19380 [Hymenobacter sp. CRA2]
MAPLAVRTGPPVVLGVALTIARHERVRLGSVRTLRLQIGPSLDLIYLAEVNLPGNLSCLAPLTEPNVVALTLRAARLELLPDESEGSGKMSNLKALGSGQCFLTTQNRKVLVAAFAEAHVQPHVVHMTVENQVNLLEYLRTDWFTLELSGTHRCRLTRALPLRLELEFDMQRLGAAAA